LPNAVPPTLSSDLPPFETFTASASVRSWPRLVALAEHGRREQPLVEADDQLAAVAVPLDLAPMLEEVEIVVDRLPVLQRHRLVVDHAIDIALGL
jgi:hypothetical protein